MIGDLIETQTINDTLDLDKCRSIIYRRKNKSTRLGYTEIQFSIVPTIMPNLNGPKENLRKMMGRDLTPIVRDERLNKPIMHTSLDHTSSVVALRYHIVKVESGCQGAYAITPIDSFQDAVIELERQAKILETDSWKLYAVFQDGTAEYFEWYRTAKASVTGKRLSAALQAFSSPAPDVIPEDDDDEYEDD